MAGGDLKQLRGLTFTKVDGGYLARVPGCSATGKTRAIAAGHLKLRLTRGLAAIDAAIKKGKWKDV